MRTRQLAMLMLMGLLPAWSIAASARPATTDGCVLLADIVYTQVYAARTGGGGTVSLRWRNAGTMRCAHTAYTASAAFTRALRDAHLFVTWSSREQQRNYVCRSDDLARCRPVRDALTLPFGHYDSGFVAASWRAVTASLAGAMRGGIGGDLSEFDAERLRRELRQRLGQPGSVAVQR